MKKLIKILVPGLLLAAIMLAFTLPVYAASLALPHREGKVILGGNYTLANGQTLDGDLAVLGGNVLLEENTYVNGSVFLAGGNMIVHGTVSGDVIIMGGNINLEKTAIVNGDVNTIGGSLNQTPGSQILGKVITNERPLDLVLPHSLATPRYSFNFDPVAKGLGWIFQALALAALAMIVVLLAPNGTNRAALAAAHEPVGTGGVGLLTVLLAPAVVLLLSITIIGIPLALLAVMALVVAVVFGWIALGLELGRRMAHMLNVNWSLPLAAGFGALVLSLVANGIGFIPCVGWLAPFLVSIVGLGAVILTRFGFKPYPAALVVAPVTAYEPAYPHQPAAPAVIPPSSPPAAPPTPPAGIGTGQ